MKLIHYILIAFSLQLFTSCEKELSLESGNVNVNEVKAKEFQVFILAKKFRLKTFYSDIPIDYIRYDTQVKSETNLWPYVINYLKDDINIFQNNAEVTIEQNTNKMPGLSDSVLLRAYSIGIDNEGVYMNFLDYQYQPLKYRLFKKDVDYFILSIKGDQNNTLYSRFEVLP